MNIRISLVLITSLVSRPGVTLAACLALLTLMPGCIQNAQAGNPTEPEDSTTLVTPIRSIDDVSPVKLAQKTESIVKTSAKSSPGEKSGSKSGETKTNAKADSKTEAQSDKTQDNQSATATKSGEDKPDTANKPDAAEKTDKTEKSETSVKPETSETSNTKVTTNEATDSAKSAEKAGSKQSGSADNSESANSAKTASTIVEAKDPVQQALSGATLSKSGSAALEHFALAQKYLSKWQLPLAEVELEVTLMNAPNMKIAHRDYSIVSFFSWHPIRAAAEALMTVGIFEPVPLTAPERKDLMQHASQVHYRSAIVLAHKAETDNKDKDEANSLFDQAITELLWAQRYTPEKHSVSRSLAFCYASKGDFKLAEKEYNLCVSLDPDDAFARADFSNLLAEHGDKDAAANQLSQAIKSAPRVAALHVDMGWLAQTRGDFNQAAVEFQQAINICPKQPGLWLQLGKVLERAGKTDEAKNAYTRVLALDASENEAKQRLNALKSAPGDDKSSEPSPAQAKSQS